MKRLDNGWMAKSANRWTLLSVVKVRSGIKSTDQCQSLVTWCNCFRFSSILYRVNLPIGIIRKIHNPIVCLAGCTTILIVGGKICQCRSRFYDRDANLLNASATVPIFIEEIGLALCVDENTTTAL